VDFVIFAEISPVFTTTSASTFKQIFITYPKEQIWKDRLIVQIKRYVRRRRVSISMLLGTP
jgi:hypothetical protein